jgi:hypothetical protein
MNRTNTNKTEWAIKSGQSSDTGNIMNMTNTNKTEWDMSNTTGVFKEAGTASRSRAPEFTPSFLCGVSFTLHFSFLCCVVFLSFLCIRHVHNVASVAGLSTLDCPFCFVCIRSVHNVASVAGLSTLDWPFSFPCIRPIPNVASVSGLSTLDCPFGFL